MGIGHIAVGIGLKRADRRLNAGILVFAALLADFLLGVFVFLGLEDYFVPPNFATVHYLQFEFPYSHGLAASIGWAGAAALAALLLWRRREGRRRRIALIVGWRCSPTSCSTRWCTGRSCRYGDQIRTKWVSVC
ncbi:MAG TPA: hypothetical protein VEU62_18880 [Bryobacterales bacterium]|nr:hypothetical protein [Bryobacterales bacterium]